jgi:hypothetical protein
MQDGTHITLRSAVQGMFMSAVNGGGSEVAANQGKGCNPEEPDASCLRVCALLASLLVIVLLFKDNCVFQMFVHAC